jgi:hypothetical protein
LEFFGSAVVAGLIALGGLILTIFLLPTPFMNWLVKTVNIADGIPSPDLPAEAHIADEAVVTRNSDTKPCSF